jgi:hypothetical protein
MGRHTKKGGYIVDWSRVRTYMVPSNEAMEGFKVWFLAWVGGDGRHCGSVLLCLKMDVGQWTWC